MARNKPDSFLEIIVHDDTHITNLVGLCAGFEQGNWRREQLAQHLFEWLPDFALNHTEAESLNSGNAIAKLRQAAFNIYSTNKFERRGEFGELLLHAVLCDIYETIPAISKIYYKDGPNDTVKGFDAVHVINSKSGLELWLGEVKFYKKIDSAIRDVVKELRDHSNLQYLRTEFAAITNKIDSSWPFANQLEKLLHTNVSLDEVFEKVRMPVLLTYDSKTLEDHSIKSDKYVAQIESELLKHHDKFCSSLGTFKLEIHLFLVPLKSKKELLETLQKKLEAWKNI